MSKSVRRLAAASLALLLTAPAALPVLAAGLSITTPYPSVSVEPGGSTQFPLTITTDSPERVDVSVSRAPQGWKTTFKGGGFTVNAVYTGGDKPPTLDLEVEVPADAAAQTYEVVVTAKGPSGAATLPLGLTVSDVAGGQVTLTTQFPAQRGDADATFEFDLRLSNETLQEARFSLETAGPEGWKVDARPASDAQATTAVVGAGDETNVTVKVDPPNDVAAGTYPVAVRAVGGGKTAVAELQVEITGNYAMAIETPDQRLNARAVAGSASELTLRLRNDGTAPLTAVSLTATPPSGWKVTFAPETVEQIAPGETAEVKATIVPSGQAVAGDYVVTINGRAAEASATDSVEIRTTVETSPLWGLVGLLLIGGVLLGLGWVFRRYGRR
ncbi:MAG TPA: NEW3 domain-containing protein [Candidatus Limnocylindrales bacterium]|nr:NEW3 domain-containing protein [Candidatus Limnocylindrales bacterium]